MDNLVKAGLFTVLFMLAVIGLSAGLSLALGFFIAKMLAALGVVEYSAALFLGVSAVVFLLMLVTGGE